jgi:hypothetical protein
MSTKSTQNSELPNTSSKKPKTPFIVAYFDPDIRAKDPSGRDLDDVLTYSDNQISRKHDFIQYLFPLPEESMVNPWAPLITKQVYEAFRDRDELRSELLQAFQRMLDFYGFTLSASESGEAGTQIVPAQNFKEQSKYSWRRAMDHNHLRLTRIIRCLRVLSCEREAHALYHALLEYDKGDVVRSSSKMFWGRAAERPLWLPPDEPDDDAEGIAWLREVCAAQEEQIETAGEESKAQDPRTTQNNGKAKDEEKVNVDVVDKADASQTETDVPAGQSDEAKTSNLREQRTTDHSEMEHVNIQEAETKVGTGENTAEREKNKHQ